MDLLFPGLKAMESIHPVFVHFPVVLLPLALVVHALTVWCRRDDWQRAALWGRLRRQTRPVEFVLMAGLLVLNALLVVAADRGGQLAYQFGVPVQKEAAADPER